MTDERTSESVLELSQIEDPALVAAAVEGVEPHDAARLLENMPVERAADVTPHLETERFAQICTAMDPERAAELLDGMTVQDASAVLAEMNPDDRVDILDEFDEEKHDELVAGLDHEDQEEVRTLEQYAPDTAGGIMTTEVTRLYEYLTVADAIEQLRKLSEELEQMFYVYVIDKRGHLVGVLSMRDLILARPDRVLHDIMIPDVRAVPGHMDQEEVAENFRRYHYLAMPVVDERNRLIGLITVDDVVDVLHEEQTEDIHRMFGAGAEEKLSSPWFYSFRMRTPWLVVNLGTAILAGLVVAMFSDTIEAVPIIAAFMPIVAGMGGNASAQAMAVSVRGLSLAPDDIRNLRQVVRRELIVGVLNGILIGGLMGLLAFVYSALLTSHTTSRAATLGILVWAAMMINLSVACMNGAGIPFIMKRLGFDPAQSATIFATTLTDIIGFFALLGLTALAGQYFGVL